jgi:hypothetical protein
VTVTPPSYFAVGECADEHVRLSLGQPPSEQDLRAALREIRDLAGGKPGDPQRPPGFFI